MKQQTKQWLAIGAAAVLLYMLLKPKKVTTASTAEDKKKLAEEPAPQKSFDAGFRNYVDTSSNSFFQTVSTRDPRDIKV